MSVQHLSKIGLAKGYSAYFTSKDTGLEMSNNGEYSWLIKVVELGKETISCFSSVELFILCKDGSHGLR